MFSRFIQSFLRLKARLCVDIGLASCEKTAEGKVCFEQRRCALDSVLCVPGAVLPSTIAFGFPASL